jgi:glycosyltransferase involved in cell wall biosynthesis
MKVLINFGPLKSGGGQNVALNFLFGLDSADLTNTDLLFLVAENSGIHRYLERVGKYPYWIVPKNPLARIMYERFVAKRVIKREKVDIVYSYFGFGVFGSGVTQVCGSANSNIYFPEIHFWVNCSVLYRFKKYIVDQYRIWGVRCASAVVFENLAMQVRGEQIHGLGNTKLIKPSVAIDPNCDRFEMPNSVPRGSFKALFLCGWQENKNVARIPDIAAETRRLGGGCHFILTAPPDGSQMHRRLVARAHELGVENAIEITGPVDKSRLASLYEQVDCVLLLSKLESFSNNIIEAWFFQRPLIVSSLEWARAICKDGAIYVDRDSPDEIAEMLLRLASNREFCNGVVRAGLAELKGYPSIVERINEEFRYLKYVLANN